MDINELTIGQAKEPASLFGDSQTETDTGLNSFVGVKCIVRTYADGVWFGTVHQKAGKEVIIKNARRMWKWHTKKSISLSSVAIHGINESKSKIAEPVALHWVEAIGITPCTGAAIRSLEGAENAKAS